MIKEQALKLGPLVNHKKAWAALEGHLSEQHQWTLRALVGAISELEMRQLQGKAALLETLLNLRVNALTELKSETKE
tara:strand:- start:564 stop:794 length:231 start_codon:yes stop_codon:yes gene_type:complete